eukprot:CAMPEP_0172371842 /NCGR_PEP_ID=MMETSP1060-20121228/45103_1 /TAXON_ID=37318 /ORGANISM="Pseudo-nitzschia pungens, Strain cf. cingulata" /LENGTH=291 /DNA_ID=CAMNT_0013097599 /DNA_START=9 /DNA_END=884 /DNA_ORIENTATION=-
MSTASSLLSIPRLQHFNYTLSKQPFETTVGGDENSYNQKMISMNKRNARDISVGCRSNQDEMPLKMRRLNPSCSPGSSTSSLTIPSFRFMVLPRKSSSFEPTIPVLSPYTYMTISLKNKKIKTRIDSFSIEQALYFEPYQEADIHIDLLKALRGADLEKLRSLKNDTEKKYDLEARNQFGENLLHLVCRMGLSLDILEYLVKDVKVPLNVRDRMGRTPLHNACMSALPNFDNIDFLMRIAPKLAVFEDDKNKIPFELIPPRVFERWSRFLSERSVLKKLATELAKHEGLQG